MPCVPEDENTDTDAEFPLRILVKRRVTHKLSSQSDYWSYKCLFETTFYFFIQY